MSEALAVVEARPRNRLPGVAAATNPLVGAVAYATDENVKDLDLEIAATESFLAGLKAMRQAVAAVVAVPAKPAAVVTVVAEVEPEPEPEPSKKPAYVRPAAPPPKPDPVPADDEDDDPDDTPIEPKEEPKARVLMPNGRNLPPKDSPERAKAEKALREKVAMLVFKRGLATNGEIIQQCGVGARIINDFMTHPWFEKHMEKWRLTPAGKNEGLVDF